MNLKNGMDILGVETEEVSHNLKDAEGNSSDKLVIKWKRSETNGIEIVQNSEPDGTYRGVWDMYEVTLDSLESE